MIGEFKLKDAKDIIKSLESCGNGKCGSCSYNSQSSPNCRENLCKDGVSILKEQEESIRSLRSENANLYKEMYYRL